MADVLTRIVERKRVEVADRLRRVPDAVPTSRSLRAALAKPRARFIMEVKRRSPSGHVGRHSLEAAVAAYAGVADALSVLTDGPDFGGSLDDLVAARARFDGPILAKDFVVDPAQVHEARAAGADAVLVMLSVLADDEAREVMARAELLSMDALVEVHDEVELNRALGLGARLIGINNRDLKTLTTDLAVTERLAPRVPDEVMLVAESGVRSRADVLRLAPHVDAFLVGSSLMAAADIGEAARALLFGRVKICGLTRAEDVRSAAEAGATHAGLILVPGTPRALTVEAARPLSALARSLGMTPVGVFRDAPVAEIVETARALQFGAIQLHGAEDAATIDALRSALPGVELFTVCAVGADVAPARGGDRTLFDSAERSVPFDLGRMAGRTDLARAFVAGGLTPETAPAAAGIGAHGIDLCSGLEAAPGHKDPTKIGALFEALRPAARGQA